nr:AlpA family phage regulatory protein [Escherichia coli]
MLFTSFSGSLISRISGAVHIALTSRNVAWDLSEVEQWIEERKSSGIQATRPGNTIGA